eukprot:c14051_g1_i2.p1 GENE.c14051_g1_i2~~c14051_g1_i2.p1  ORF type:complete len:404 (-),score=35.09 c14051_g1_i2:11-1222(-)
MAVKVWPRSLFQLVYNGICFVLKGLWNMIQSVWQGFCFVLQLVWQGFYFGLKGLGSFIVDAKDEFLLLDCGLKAIALFAFVACLFPLTVLLWILFNFSLTQLEKLVVSFFVIFLGFMMIAGVALLVYTNASSISGMVTQRFHKASYLAIIIVVANSCFASCFIICGARARELCGKKNNFVAVCMAALSPLVSSLIFIFPLVAPKSAAELGFTPLLNPAGPVPAQPSHNSIVDSTIRAQTAELGLAPEAQHSSGQSESNVQRRTDRHGRVVVEQTNDSPPQYKFFFLPGVSPGVHCCLHYVVVVIGVGLGYFSVVINLKQGLTSPLRTIDLVFLISSSVGLCCFLLLSCIRDLCRMGLNFRMWLSFFLEFVGLYYYNSALVLTSIVAGDIVRDDFSDSPLCPVV